MSFFATCKTWHRQENASAAVEFSLVCIPFIYLTIAIIELSLYFASANMLESGLNQSARMIKTGQLQTNNANDELQAFRTALCTRLVGLLDCNNVVLEAIPMPDNQFTSAADYPPQYDANGKMVSQGFDAGQSNTVVLVRAAYSYSFWTPLFSSLFSSRADHTVPLLSTVVLETEPYTFNPNAS